MYIDIFTGYDNLRLTRHAYGDKMPDLDLIDRKIIAELMQDVSQPVVQISNKVGLSQTPCWKRIQRLEATGIVSRRVALADPVKLGFSLTVFTSVTAPDHSPAWRETFIRVAMALPEVMEIYRMAGDADYILKVSVADMSSYDAFYKKLSDAVTIKSITSSFAMERLKYTTAYPVDTRNH